EPRCRPIQLSPPSSPIITRRGDVSAPSEVLLCSAPKTRPAGAMLNLRFSLSGVYFPARISVAPAHYSRVEADVYSAISLPRRRGGRATLRARGATLQRHAAQPVQRHQATRT